MAEFLRQEMKKETWASRIDVYDRNTTKSQKSSRK
jgi:hypothetical protein